MSSRGEGNFQPIGLSGNRLEVLARFMQPPDITATPAGVIEPDYAPVIPALTEEQIAAAEAERLEQDRLADEARQAAIAAQIAERLERERLAEIARQEAEAAEIARREAAAAERARIEAEVREKRHAQLTGFIEEVTVLADDELNTVRVFSPTDMKLGAGAIVGNVIVKRAHGYRPPNMDPRRLSDPCQRPNPNVAPRSLAEEAAHDFVLSSPERALANLVIDGRNGSGISPEIGRTLQDALEPRTTGIKRLRKPEEVTNQQVADAIKGTFVDVARAFSAKTHADIFASVGVDLLTREIVTHDMQKDFKGLVKVMRWQQGKHYEIVSEGAGQASNICVPIEPRKLNQAIQDEVHIDGWDEAGLDIPYEIEPDAIDMIIDAAGGPNGHIASVGNYTQHSFLALIPGTADPSRVGPEYTGAYMVIAYDPMNPAYQVGEKVEMMTPKNAPKVLAPNDIDLREAQIKWNVRVWQLTDLGSNIVEKEMTKAKDNPDSGIMAFVNPIHQIRQAYFEQAVTFALRGAATQQLQLARRGVNMAYDQASIDVSHGRQPENITVPELPVLPDIARNDPIHQMLVQGNKPEQLSS